MIGEALKNLLLNKYLKLRGSEINIPQELYTPRVLFPEYDTTPADITLNIFTPYHKGDVLEYEEDVGRHMFGVGAEWHIKPRRYEKDFTP